jgi:hypothetical protein
MVNSFDDIRPSQKRFVIKWLVILMFLAPKMQNPNPFSIGTLEGLVAPPDHYVSLEQRWEEEYEKGDSLMGSFFSLHTSCCLFRQHRQPRNNWEIQI